MSALEKLKIWARELKSQVIALWFCRSDPRTPWIAKLVVALVVAYALSPIDLIPVFIPVLGLLDELVILPLGIALAMKMIPAEVWSDARARAQAWEAERPKSYAGAAFIVVLWIALAWGAWTLLAGSSSRRPRRGWCASTSPSTPRARQPCRPARRPSRRSTGFR